LEFFIRNKARPDLVVVLPFLSLAFKFFGDIEIGQLGRLDNFSVDFEGKGTKVLIVDAFSSLNVLPDVFAESLDDEMELGLRVEGFGGLVGAGL
jgi:hypothetical protein